MQTPMNLSSKKGIIARLRRGKYARQRFLESHLNKTIAFQIRAMRDAVGLNQNALAEEAGMNQNAISRLESPNYGKATLTTLKRLAAAFDVCLVVRFVPFSEMVDWVSGTPRVNRGMTTQALRVPAFSEEESRGVFDQQQERQAVEEASGGDYTIVPSSPVTIRPPTPRPPAFDFDCLASGTDGGESPYEQFAAAGERGLTQ